MEPFAKQKNAHLYCKDIYSAVGSKGLGRKRAEGEKAAPLPEGKAAAFFFQEKVPHKYQGRFWTLEKNTYKAAGVVQ
ncbi:MAG: hypothetical protein J5I98_32085 [Phaeodactylibacter sp.]|nr:hypothetical protein [Phaeodactylibacter sp.]